MSMTRILKCALVAVSVVAFPNSVSHAEVLAVQNQNPSAAEVTNLNAATVRSNMQQQQRNAALKIQAKNTLKTHVASEINCLARNIYYEAGSESQEGKTAVGVVTINRSHDHRFPKTICGVVNHRLGKVCQFSWRCRSVKQPEMSDRRWIESRYVANLLMNDSSYYTRAHQRIGEVLYFHSAHVSKGWKRNKIKHIRIGAHWFYIDK